MRKAESLMRRRLSIIAYVLVGILILSVAAQAVGTAANQQTIKPSSNQTKWDLGQKELNPIEPIGDSKDEPVYVTILSFIFKLAIVVALAYGTIFALKRFNVGSLQRSNNQRIKVVENTTLGANRSLHLVDVGSKRLLVASTTSQISLLAELQADDASEVSDQTIKPSNNQAFKDQLSGFLGVKPDTGDTNMNVARVIRGSSTFLQEKIMELGRLRRNLRDA